MEKNTDSRKKIVKEMVHLVATDVKNSAYAFNDGLRKRANSVYNSLANKYLTFQLLGKISQGMLKVASLPIVWAFPPRMRERIHNKYGWGKEIHGIGDLEENRRTISEGLGYIYNATLEGIILSQLFLSEPFAHKGPNELDLGDFIAASFYLRWAIPIISYWLGKRKYNLTPGLLPLYPITQPLNYIANLKERAQKNLSVDL